jgi:large subunit ribosomal protein L1
MSTQVVSHLGDLKEGIKQALASSPKKRKFEQSVEMVVVLRDVDVKKPENRINTVVVLPYAPQKKLAKVAVIASGDLALKAKEAGADIVIDKDELNKIANDKKALRKLAKRYDFFLASTDLMPLVGRILGKYLGPRGKMPQPVPPNAPVNVLVDRAKKSIRIRIKDQPQIACRIGTESQPIEQLVENANAVLSEILKKFSASNLGKIYFKLAMGKPVKIAREGGKK